MILRIIIHITIWLIYISATSLREMVYYPNYGSLWFTNMIITMIILPLVYGNYYYLLPKLLSRRKWLSFSWALLLGTVVFTFLANQVLVYVYNEIIGMEGVLNWYTTMEGYLITGLSLILLLSLTTAVYFVRQWYVNDQKVKALEKQNLEAELTNLKNQINPHFVFNALNTIYHLIPEDADEAKDLVLNFSNSLSHQIYDGQKKWVALEKEMKYIQDYIAIEKARNQHLLLLTESWPEKLNGEMVPPLLLIPIVENAFKHSKKATGSEVSISLAIKEQRIHLVTKNSLGKDKKENMPNGIGLQNVRRRLELLFPENHLFTTEKSEDKFHAHLIIPANADTVRNY